MSVTDDVRRANRGFYEAFESLALKRMEEVWDHEGLVTCVHPGWPVAEGWATVKESWQTIFRNTTSIRFRITDERIDVRADLAWVLCVERMLADDGDTLGALIATNVFRRVGGGWLLVHHHASQFAGVLEAVEDDRVIN
jgi:ketosteroid isomerase-like protein